MENGLYLWFYGINLRIYCKISIIVFYVFIRNLFNKFSIY